MIALLSPFLLISESARAQFYEIAPGTPVGSTERSSNYDTIDETKRNFSKDISKQHAPPLVHESRNNSSSVQTEGLRSIGEKQGGTQEVTNTSSANVTTLPTDSSFPPASFVLLILVPTNVDYISLRQFKRSIWTKRE